MWFDIWVLGGTNEFMGGLKLVREKLEEGITNISLTRGGFIVWPPSPSLKWRIVPLKFCIIGDVIFLAMGGG